MPKFLALLICIPVLGYYIYTFRNGRIFLKGVVYTAAQSVGFSFAVALIATFALMILAFAFANEYMLSPLNLGMIRFIDGLAMFVRIFVLFVIVFISVFITNNARL